ncbi:glucose-6-phosphate dehydrogenase [Draconibacterium sp. IB214405]|uniref:glucose-6-phosphate dehydrogenase n=1 Tax=Draconibacterium sp. IB214405 TaxID=3097352 RepID=UPI002A0E8B6E|nr:glucose-6-phosphate dehydrogenase [Draconibacterium sp. IB214405]MDX8341044.1 glucose-6-phosphate dehydrogenase [Draconibacterium sp. IB214405]
MKKAEDQILIIFGASGDLTKRKLIPALFELYLQNLLPKKFAVIGASRSALSDDDFRKRADEFLPDDEKAAEFKKMLFYQAVQNDSADDLIPLKERLETISNSLEIEKNYIFYLSTPPSLYPVIPKHLCENGLSKSDKYFRRLIVEKPFGTDLTSAKELNKQLLNYFEEEQIYRIDHYLGKETVQNMLVTRFANGIFEPLWNRRYIERVEITSAESLGVEGRGGYYENSGAMRDMLQNHLLQVAGFVAMEPPVVVEADAIRNETLKVFQSLRPIKENEVSRFVIRGQYTSSTIAGKKVAGYREEPGVAKLSRTETFVALKFFIDNWRWAGVPFYIRTGKKLPTRVTEIVIHFRKVPHHLFGQEGSQGNNQLIIRIQPDEGILLKFGMKTPGTGFKVQTVNMDFHYSDLADKKVPAAYERLLLDCMQGDATLYARGDAVEAAWKFVQPIINAWDTNPEIPIYGYPAGSWGPEDSDKLIGNGKWRYPCKNLSNDGLYCEL